MMTTCENDKGNQGRGGQYNKVFTNMQDLRSCENTQGSQKMVTIR